LLFEARSLVRILQERLKKLLSAHTQTLKSGLWLAFFGAILLAWWVMYFMATQMGLNWYGAKLRINIGNKIQGEIETIGGLDPEKSVVITNSQYWMGPDIIATQGTRSRVRDHGRMWDFGGKSAEICPIEWSGCKP